MVQALRINTLSKLTFSDSIRFDALVKDVFPGIEFKDIEYETLAEAIRQVCKETNLVVNEIQVMLHRFRCSFLKVKLTEYLLIKILCVIRAVKS